MTNPKQNDIILAQTKFLNGRSSLTTERFLEKKEQNKNKRFEKSTWTRHDEDKQGSGRARLVWKGKIEETIIQTNVPGHGMFLFLYFWENHIPPPFHFLSLKKEIRKRGLPFLSLVPMPVGFLRPSSPVFVTGVFFSEYRIGHGLKSRRLITSSEQSHVGFDFHSHYNWADS